MLLVERRRVMKETEAAMIGPGARLSTLRDVAVVAFVVSFTFVWGVSYVQGFMNYRVSATTRKSLKCKHSEVSNNRHQYIAERTSSAAGAAPSRSEVPETNIAAPVCCSA
jgi:hypothetical protein